MSGYYSLVAIGMHISNENHEIFRAVDPNVKITMIGELLYYEYDWIKWYIDGTDEIVTVMAYLDTLGNTNYGYLRVGEESDDIDRYGCPYDFDMNIETLISVHKYTPIEQKLKELGEEE